MGEDSLLAWQHCYKQVWVPTVTILQHRTPHLMSWRFLKRDVQNWHHAICEIHSPFCVSKKREEEEAPARRDEPDTSLCWLLSWEQSHSTPIANSVSLRTQKASGVLNHGILFCLKVITMGCLLAVPPPPSPFLERTEAEGSSNYLVQGLLRNYVSPVCAGSDSQNLRSSFFSESF